MKRNGFTLVEMLAVIMVLGILLTLAVGAYYRYKKYSSDKSFEMLTSSFENGLKDAFVDCKSGFSDNSFCDSHSEPKGIGTKVKVTLRELINSEYIEKMKNPYNTNEYCDIDGSYIEVTRVSSTIDLGTELSYRVCLICGDKKSIGCN